MGDIARIECGDDARTAQLGALLLGRIPLPGDTVVLSAPVLILRAQSAGVDCSDVVWNLPPEVAITRMAQTITGSDFERMARQAIAEQLEGAGEKRRYAIENLTVPENMTVPAGELTYAVTMPQGIQPARTTTVSLAVAVNGDFYKKATYRGRVHIYENVVAAARPLRLDQKLTADDVQLVEREVAAGGLADVADAVGFVMLRTVRAGTVLTDNMLARPVILLKGVPVQLVVNRLGIHVHTEGVSLQSGRAGELIRVRNAASGKSLYGRVIDSNTVEISD